MGLMNICCYCLECGWLTNIKAVCDTPQPTLPLLQITNEDVGKMEWNGTCTECCGWRRSRLLPRGVDKTFLFLFFTNFWRKWYKGGGQIWKNWKMMGLGCIMWNTQRSNKNRVKNIDECTSSESWPLSVILLDNVLLWIY